jgi:hypothetical protein
MWGVPPNKRSAARLNTFVAAWLVDDDHAIDRGVEQGLQFFGGMGST